MSKDSRDAVTVPGSLRVKFVVVWLALCAIKLALAASLPPLLDEAFYAWEGRQLAWAYSDLPGLTAWLIRAGMELAGDGVLAMRAPFLVLGAILPWLAVSISTRWFGPEKGLWAGILVMLMPLSGFLGLLALPDVPLVFAALVCLETVASLREKVRWPPLLWLAFALVIGAFTHYRFALVVGAGLLGLCLDRRGRLLLREPRFLAMLVVGALAWWPLLEWNLAHAGAGVRFQLFERNPWTFDGSGAWWLPIQTILVTPLLFACCLLSMAICWQRARQDPDGPWRLLLGVGGLAVWAYFLLGFFADRERVSFHWPLAGWLVWLVVVPVPLGEASAGVRRLVFASTAAGTLAVLAFFVIASSPQWRNASAGDWWYPISFSGNSEIAESLRQKHLPQTTRIVADNVGLAAQLAFALPSRTILVLDHPRNHKHGRALQLQLWRRQVEQSPDLAAGQTLLVVEDSVRPMKLRLAAYHDLCRDLRGLPVPEILNVDHGRKRFLIFNLGSKRESAVCVLPSLAWIDSPRPGAVATLKVAVTGWAFKDGVGLARVEVLLDGSPAAQAHYGRAMPNVAAFWRISSDPQHPAVGFQAQLDMAEVKPGRHWLGLRLFGNDGSREDWPEQPIERVR